MISSQGQLQIKLGAVDSVIQCGGHWTRRISEHHW